MPRPEYFDERTHPINEVLLTFSIVMQMNLYVPDSRTDQRLQGRKQMRPILFFRIEESVPRRPPG
jgi:hypothetical protein